MRLWCIYGETVVAVPLSGMGIIMKRPRMFELHAVSGYSGWKAIYGDPKILIRGEVAVVVGVGVTVENRQSTAA
jgi:hypothetical protein